MNPDIPQEVRIVNAIAEQLFDVWPVSIVMIDLEDRIWRVNKQMSDELQLDTDILGKSVFDLLEVVQDKQNVLPRYLQELHEGCQRIIPLSSNCFIYEQKRHISFLIQGALIGVYEEERLVRIVLYYRNVLEERTQKRLLNIALSRTQIFQWSYDLERNLMIIDPRYFEYLGIPTRDYTLTPEEFAYLIHPDDRQSVFDALTLQLDGNLYEAPVEYRLRRDDGSWEWFEAQSTYVGQLKEAPYRIVGICMSTQKYKDTEDCLNEALRKARHSDELKSIFLANMSHEIRTPLNAIVGFSELMVYSEDPAEKEEYMSIIQSNNELLLRLINDILDLSKIESGILERKRETFNLAKVCNELYTMIQPKITNPDVEFQMDNSGPDCWIFLDRSRLKQVWMNYLTNAVKCTKSGYIKMGYSIEREGIRIYVEDSGVGIPEELQERVFGRFQKLNEFAQGTGLGLAISRAIIEGAGGEVGFTSTPGIGSTFWAWIPCEISTQKEHTPTISLPLQHQLSLNEIDKKELKILIAEDNESNYSLVQHILKSYHLTHVQNGAEAVNKVREEEFDLVLMDMKMPVMGGLEATRKIREFNNRIPIIALTANAFDADRISALDAGCNEFLAKPLKKSQLLELFSKKW